MARQYFRTQVGEAPVVSQTQIAAAADTILWNPAGLASNTAIPANTIAPGQTFKLTAWGTSTTAVTAGQTLTMRARFGTTVGGTLLGLASPAQPVNAVVRTDPWFLEMFVTFRKIGTAGEAMCVARLDDPKIVGTAATTNSASLTCGNTTTVATAVDTTVASGLLISLQPSLATYTFNCLEVLMESTN